MPNSRTVRWIAPVILLLGAAGTGPVEARTPLACGTTITVDTTLHADLVGCPDTGLVIGADDITLDLNGHSIEGDGRTVSSCPVGRDCDVGVENRSGHREVTVEGGSVRQFAIGVLIGEGAVHDRVQDMATSTNSDFGIVASRSTGTVLEWNAMTDNGTSGLVVSESPRTRIRHNTVSGSHGYGIALFGVDDSNIDRNTLRNSDHGILCDACRRDAINRNVVTHSGGSSIDIGDGAADNQIQHNRLTDNGDGIIITNGHDNLIRRNDVTGTGFFGFPDTGGFGLILDGSSRTTISRNRITGGRGPAVLVTSLDSPSPSTDNVVSRNIVASTLADGIAVDHGATGSLVLGNVASRNGDDGIDVDGAPATTVSRNITNRNRDLGIEAGAGAHDGGRNHATRNGDPAQCTGVTCQP
jgi:parallel beta-helix repeat protein